MKEAILYTKLDDENVQCNVCLRRCVIANKRRGFCGTRLNKDGVLHTLIYEKVSSICIDPIEKKPFFHFHPGTLALSLGTLGCNFKCPGCQNWEISHQQPDTIGTNTQSIPSYELIAICREHKAPGIAWTYNEPSIWIEYTLEGAKLAKENNLYTCFVSNGYATKEQWDLIGPYLDGCRVDVKAFSKESYKRIAGISNFEEILNNILYAKEKFNTHIEIITNVTPTINDSETELRSIAGWIYKYLGEMTPWHVTRFYPHLELSHLPPTPIKTLEKAKEIGEAEGLKYVYIGNVYAHPAENTYCHNCKNLIIERKGFYIAKFLLKDLRCKFCNTQIPIVL